jgi:hypothetical protein
MKTAAAILLLAVMVSGCGQKPDPRVAKFEARITALESNNAELFRQADNRWNDCTNLLANQKSITAQMAGMFETNGIFSKLVANVDYNDTMFALIESQITNLQSAQSLPRPVARQYYVAPAVHGQMPADVAAQIRAKALAKWPTDYEMQAYEIKNQTAAWHQVNP